MLGLMLFVATGAAGFAHIAVFHAPHDAGDHAETAPPVHHDHGDRHGPDGPEQVRCHVLLALSSVQAAAPAAELTLERYPIAAEPTPAMSPASTAPAIPGLTLRGPPAA